MTQQPIKTLRGGLALYICDLCGTKHEYMALRIPVGWRTWAGEDGLPRHACERCSDG